MIIAQLQLLNAKQKDFRLVSKWLRDQARFILNESSAVSPTYKARLHINGALRAKSSRRRFV